MEQAGGRLSTDRLLRLRAVTEGGPVWRAACGRDSPHRFSWRFKTRCAGRGTRLRRYRPCRTCPKSGLLGGGRSCNARCGSDLWRKARSPWGWAPGSCGRLKRAKRAHVPAQRVANERARFSSRFETRSARPGGCTAPNPARFSARFETRSGGCWCVCVMRTGAAQLIRAEPSAASRPAASRAGGRGRRCRRSG